MNRTLVLLRHAKAQQLPPRVPDHERPLADQGHRDAQAAGEWLSARGVVPERVLCSTSLRTRETWAGLSGALGAVPVELCRAIYDGGTDGVWRTVREDGGEATTLLVVGHAPTVPELAEVLSAGAGSAAAQHAMAQGYPTCGIAVLRFTGEWADLTAGSASLEHFHVARAGGPMLGA